MRLTIPCLLLLALLLGACTKPTDKPEDCTRDEFFDEALESCQRCPSLAAPRCLPGCGFIIVNDARGCAAPVCAQTCDLCPAWAFFSDVSLTCEACPDGQRFDPAVGRCVDCPAGQRFDRDQLTCVLAPPDDMSRDFPEDMPDMKDLSPDQALDMDPDMASDMDADMADG
jgi:hypothetical protein